MRIKNVGVAKYNPKKPVILSNEIIENCRYSLSPNGFMLLMGLSQSIDYTNEIWPDFEVDITGLFKFLHLSQTNGKRYDTVRQAFENILDNPLKIRRNARSWSGIPWLSYHYDEEISTRVKVNFHHDVVPFLLAFKNAIGGGTKGYTKLLPHFYQKFESRYATWLYPFFKKWQDSESYKTVKIKKEISTIREKTFTEKDYKKTSDWLKYVLNKAINEINKKTDIYVRPIARENHNITSEGKGKAFTHVFFYIDTKKEFIKEKEEKDTLQKKLYLSIEDLRNDFVKVEQVSPELKQGIENHQGSTLQNYADKNSITYVKIGDKHYFCK